MTTTETTEPRRTMMTCDECGGTNVNADAFATWDFETQDWVLKSTFDKGADCSDCEGPCGIEPVMVDFDDEEQFAACGDCNWHGLASFLEPIKDIHERVAAGETMPAGECPICGALAHHKPVTL